MSNPRGTNANVPQIPQPIAEIGSLAMVVQALKQGVDSLAGYRGGPFDRAVTFKDLVDLKLVSGLAVLSSTGSGGGSTSTSTLSGIVGLSQGGTGADLSASGGPNQAVWLETVGGPFNVRQPAFADLSGQIAAGQIAAATITNAMLVNSSLTIAGHVVVLGGSQTLAAADLTNGTTGSGAVVLASTPSVANLTVTGGFTATGLVTNADLVNSSITIAGHVVVLGGSQTLATGDLTDIGTFSLNTSGTIKTTNTTAATNRGSGALQSAGGLGVTGDIWANTLNTTGAISAAAWGSGLTFSVQGVTLTDTTSTGTVATNFPNHIAPPSLAASAVTTYTDAATFHIGAAPTAGTNVTITNAWSLYVGGATRVGALTLASGGTLSGTLTGGTFSGGTWQGTKIGLQYGGTNADLSATGGTSQFLRQASAGAAVTVVQPAFSDLSGQIAAGQIAAATITNAMLVNSSLTIGSTAVSLGGTAATVAGLTLTSPTINDPVMGGAKVCTSTLTKTSDTALANITGLSIPLTAGATYILQGHIVGASGASGGVKLRLAAGGGLTATACNASGWVYNGATIAAYNNITAFPGNPAASTVVYTDIIVEGYIVVNVGGNLLIQGAQNLSNTTSTTFLVGSSFQAIRVS